MYVLPIRHQFLFGEAEQFNQLVKDFILHFSFNPTNPWASKKTRQKQKQKSKHSPELTLKGRLEVTRSGMGYVIVDGGDVLVRPGDFATALNGDTVRVKVVKENIRTGKKEGRILEVVTRKQTEFVGHLQLSTNHAFLFLIQTNPCRICLFH